jgi:hypothetical protein
MLNPLSIVRRFATALDRSDFAEAARYLAPGCRYDTGHGELTGPEAIIASYRESDEWGRGVLDQVVFESEVQQENDGSFTVLYLDRIRLHGETLEYRSRQHLWLNDDGQVVRILHEELPGQREALDAFFARHGLRR